MAEQGCDSHIGKAVGLKPGFQLLLSDVRGDQRVGRTAGSAGAVDVVVEHSRRFEGGNHNTKTSRQCIHLYNENVNCLYMTNCSMTLSNV